MNYVYLTPQGVIVADTSTTLSQVEGEWKQAFGADLIVTADTPQGVMITAETLARDNVINNNAALANQINPNISGGVFLDAILALTGVQRDAKTPTIVTAVTVTGTPGTIIPQGSIAQTSALDNFATQSAVTLDSSGNGVVIFASVVMGPIPCAPSALNIIVSAVLGWETVNNTNAGVLGTLTQSDQSARAFRLNTLAYNGISLAEAISSALYNTPDVTSLSFLENIESQPMGILIAVSSGATLAGTVWGLTNTGEVVVGTNPMIFAESSQTVPTPNPWPPAKYTTIGNVSLTGLATQGGGDWGGAMTAGDTVLVKNQTTTTQNGLYVVASGAWGLATFNTTGTVFLGSNNGISMKPNSVYACVAGGSDTNVAAALLENKSSGCAWNGGTDIPLTEPSSGQVYDVLFDRPAPIAILVRATVANITAQSAIQAILDYAAGLIQGVDGFVVGQDVSPFELSGAIVSENPGAYVSSVTIAVVPVSGSPSYSTNTIPIGLNQIATVTVGDITVTLA